jgi:hypothetical protein
VFVPEEYYEALDQRREELLELDWLREMAERDEAQVGAAARTRTAEADEGSVP